MRIRHSLGGAAVLVTVAGLGWAGASTASADEPPVFGVCQHRLCLIVLDSQADSDGDGVTDEDEIAMGTDPEDPTSRPDAGPVLDAALDRRLPSFERHFTEIVALPQTAPDGTALATGLGPIALPEKGNPLSSLGSLLATLGGQGMNLTGNVLVRSQQPPIPTSLGGGSPAVPFGPMGRMSLYADGVVGPTSYGPNGGKPGATVTGGRGSADAGTRTADFMYTKEGDTTHNVFGRLRRRQPR